MIDITTSRCSNLVERLRAALRYLPDGPAYGIKDDYAGFAPWRESEGRARDTGLVVGRHNRDPILVRGDPDRTALVTMQAYDALPIRPDEEAGVLMTGGIQQNEAG